MKILVLSDSHGNINPMCTCVEMVQPQHILHLGDCLPDAEELHGLYPAIPMTTVPGNCDFGSVRPQEVLLELGGHRILMMHGHTRHVKFGNLQAEMAAREAGAEILLFGHTHQSLVCRNGDFWMMNPGSIGYRPLSYGVITIEGDKVDCSVYRL